MTQQLDIAWSRFSDPDTSHAAAQSVSVTDLEARVLAALNSAPNGLTSEELADKLNLSLVTVSPRLRPLFNKGKVEQGGKRLNKSGRSALVWRIK